MNWPGGPPSRKSGSPSYGEYFVTFGSGFVSVPGPRLLSSAFGLAGPGSQCKELIFICSKKIKLNWPCGLLPWPRGVMDSFLLLSS
jgi:hypothetical protein